MPISAETLRQLRKLVAMQRNPALAQFEQDRTHAEALAAISDFAIKRTKGDKGDPGADPDYEYIVHETLKRIRQPRDGETPVIDYPRIIREVIKAIPRPTDGKDAVVDYDRILLDVLSQIPAPVPGKDGSPDTPLQVFEKFMKALDEGAVLDTKRIKGADRFITQADLDRALTILDQRTSFLINRNNNVGSSSSTIYNETFTTSGGAETFTLARTPTTIISVVVNSQSLNSTAGYTSSGTGVTLVDSNTPSGLAVNIVYS